jgi:hypothetical protein
MLLVGNVNHHQFMAVIAMLLIVSKLDCIYTCNYLPSPASWNQQHSI